MRRRELIAALVEIKTRPWSSPWWPSRQDVLNLAVKETTRLKELEALLPEIIEKLRTHDRPPPSHARPREG